MHEIREAYLEQIHVATNLGYARAVLRDECMKENPNLKFLNEFPPDFQKINWEWHKANNRRYVMRDQIIKDLNNRVCDIGNGMVLVPIITEEYADLVEMELIPD